MIQGKDPFSGYWKFEPFRSNLSTSAPKSWSQDILVGPDDPVQQEIVRSDGTATILRAQASFDRKQYAVEGSPIVEIIAYKRTDQHTITGTGMKQGNTPYWNNYGES